MIETEKRRRVGEQVYKALKCFNAIELGYLLAACEARKPFLSLTDSTRDRFADIGIAAAAALLADVNT